MNTETIFAIATGAGRAGIAVIRVSGPACAVALECLTGAPPPPPRVATRARFVAPGGEEMLDDGLCLWFPAPASYTGEDVAELHVHGGPATLAAMIDALGRIPGLRLAAPGEFSRRAFENGKLDLTAIEGLADLIDAETEAQRRQALRQLGGALGAMYQDWREALVGALAQLEATIDFPDEDLPDHIEAGINHQISRVITEVTQHLADDRRGERLRDGYYIAVLGPPNSGKSSLINMLAQREAAIVSAQAGTTRDVIEVHLDLGGYPVIVADTAGLRAAGDDIEREGVRRALARAEESDLKILVLDGACAGVPDTGTCALIDENTVVVRNKIDLVGAGAPAMIVAGVTAMDISAQTGAGIADLLERMTSKINARLSLPAAAPPLTRHRHRAALEACRAALLRAGEAAAPELKAEDLRLAVRSIGTITGNVDVEDILDVVFRDFCIGK